MEFIRNLVLLLIVILWTKLTKSQNLDDTDSLDLEDDLENDRSSLELTSSMKQALRTFLKEKQNQQSVYRSSDDMVHTITESMGGEQIVGGEEADYGQIYSIVSLRSKRCGKKCPIHNGKRIPFHACGGVLLTRSVVLTAAHCCIDEKTAKRDRKRRKSTKIHEAWAGGVMVHDLLQKRKIKRMVVHPKADGAQQYDLCMVKTGKFNIDKRKKTKLNTAKINSKDIKVNSTLVVAGWGANYQGQKTAYDEELFYIKIKKMSYKECKNRLARLKHSDGYTYDSLLHKGVLCTRQGKLRDACQGDSGGPLYHITPDKKQKGKENLGPWNLLVGIVSWGAGCAKPGRPAMYVDVHYFNDWIKSAFKKLKSRRNRRRSRRQN